MTEEKENKREHIYPWEGVRDLSKNREGTLFFAMGLTMLVKLLVVENLKANASNLLGTSTSLVTTMPDALLEPTEMYSIPAIMHVPPVTVQGGDECGTFYGSI